MGACAKVLRQASAAAFFLQQATVLQAVRHLLLLAFFKICGQVLKALLPFCACD